MPTDEFCDWKWTSLLHTRLRPNVCPSCSGTCCRDTARGTRVEHMGAAHYVHDCGACTGGTKHGTALLVALRTIPTR